MIFDKMVLDVMNIALQAYVFGLQDKVVKGQDLIDALGDASKLKDEMIQVMEAKLTDANDQIAEYEEMISVYEKYRDFRTAPSIPQEKS